ncbi:MAG: biotin-dependent carboxyltransferase family protein [Acidobacteriota bacterium]
MGADLSGALIVHHGGALTTVQDLGRVGWSDFGVPTAGALDTIALRLANRMVGNSDQAAGIEMHLQGPVLQARTDTWVAVIGGRFGPQPGAVMLLRKGERLDLRDGHGTPRAVLAVRGGIDVEPILGSRSTCLAAGFGGVHGRALRAGDLLPIGSETVRNFSHGVPPGLMFESDNLVSVRVLRGPHVELLGDATLRALCSASWTASRTSNRTGFRLDGPKLELCVDADSLSPIPTALGTIQVTAAGQPIVLLCERPVTGGYPQLATVIAADIGAIVRAPFGATFRFRVVDHNDARRALQLQTQQLTALTEDL